MYNKSERGKRSSVIFAFSAFSSAFGGVLAFGLTQINGPNGFTGWRWLFCIEGALTLLFVPLVWFVFPVTPTTAWFLTAEEKQMMQARYDSDPSWGYNEEFSWKECSKVFADPKWYAFWIYQFCVDISLYGLSTFMPSIVKGLGYTSIHANLMTVPIYMCALVFFLVLAYFSDRSGVRWPFLAGPLCCLIVGYAILIGSDNAKVRFFACFGMYPSLILDKFPLTHTSRRIGYLSHRRTVAYVAARQRREALQKGHYDRFHPLLCQYSRRCCGPDLHCSNGTTIHQGNVYQLGSYSRGSGHGGCFGRRYDLGESETGSKD